MKLLLTILLCGLVSCTPVPSEEEARHLDLLEFKEDVEYIMEDVEDIINNLLGITTTKATPIIDAIGGILGGESTTTAATTTNNVPLIGALINLLFPTTTTTKCGGLIGGGLLC